MDRYIRSHLIEPTLGFLYSVQIKMCSRRPRESGATGAGDAPAPSASRRQRREAEAAAAVEDGNKKQKTETTPQSSPAIYNFNRYDKDHY
jgi:hypothetical protein